ncbi:MAG: Acyl-CoA dehydrogenase, short-chain specific, partial [Nocardioidaceae bacterium]|nr:Acyl-CoA dehydrogenase, short-chain specific [Nocardioidaceae bacterium]
MDAELEKGIKSAVESAAKESSTFSSARLVELGWDELLADDPETAVRALFEESGNKLISSSALDSVVLAALDAPWSWTTTRVGYPRPGNQSASAADGRIDAVLLADVEGIEQVVVPLDTADGIKLYVVALADGEASPIGGIDKALGLYRFTADSSKAVLAEGALADGWPAALLVARRAVSHQIIGLSHKMMDIAVDHVTVRHQFGRPLGANQAIQHRLADAKVEISAAETFADESWATATQLSTSAAKGQASRAIELMAK